MKMNVPCIGTHFTLTQDWPFTLYHERRNMTLVAALGVSKSGYTGKGYSFGEHEKGTYKAIETEVVFPAGTVLKVDRIYIKRSESTPHGLNKGGEYNSITLRVVKDHPEKKVNKKRFWVKLYDFNQIECDIDQTTMQAKV